MKLFVEGGGDARLLKDNCRRGFRLFLEKAGLDGYMPSIVACGSRGNAYEDFCVETQQGKPAMLLIDSEAPVNARLCCTGELAEWKPWLHLKQRQGDKWNRPSDTDDSQCHLMVQCMESWFLADRHTLEEFFGQGFDGGSLPAESRAIESVPKEEVYEGLHDATKSCKTKASYGKGDHSFKLLALIDPNKVTQASPWAQRFVILLKAAMGVPPPPSAGDALPTLNAASSPPPCPSSSRRAPPATARPGAGSRRR